MLNGISSPLCPCESDEVVDRGQGLRRRDRDRPIQIRSPTLHVTRVPSGPVVEVVFYLRWYV